jgi:uncharacterized protein with HEPN domain
MLSDKSRQSLIDIRENIRFAKAFLENKSIDALLEDRLTFYATTRCLEIVSEASRRLDDEIRERHPDLPWRKIMGVGNVYRHDYDNVDEEFVWRTVHESLGALLAAVEAELAAG